jgi:splicing factor 1
VRRWFSKDYFEFNVLCRYDEAARLVHPLLTPLDSEHNMHKQRQLRELAEINGTIKDVSKLQEMLVEEEQKATMYKLDDALQVKVGLYKL